MKNKLIVWGLILATSIIVLPGTSLGSSDNTGGVIDYEHSASPTQERHGGRGGRGRRGRGRGSDDHLEGGHRSRGHHAKRSHHRTRIVKKVFYRNGRRYVRNVRVHN